MHYPRRVFIFLLGCFAAAVGKAQINPANPIPPARQDDRVAESQRNAAHRATFQNAKAFAKGGNLAGAEAALLPLNTAKPGTAAWHRNNSQRLLQLADQLREEGRIDLVRSIALSALQRSEESGRAATTAKERAGAQAHAGYIQERFFGDKRAALRAYEAASLEAPEARSLHDAIARLKRELGSVATVGNGK